MIVSVNVNDYKFDNRTKEEFVSDMKKGLEAEVTSINIFRDILDNSDVQSPEIIYVGSNEEGKISYDENKEVANVDLFPDYLLKYKENRRIRANFIEVKVCHPFSKECYFKVKQLEQYRELEKVVILFVMGYGTYHPKFALVKPEDILALGIEPVEVYGKSTIKVPSEQIAWLPFNRDYKFNRLLTRDYIR
jgi:hypothetical protein